MSEFLLSLNMYTGCLHKPTMVRKCCVTNCNGNYDNDSKEKDFPPPKNKQERKKWLKTISRDNTPN